jgi:hypothetical protein
MTTPHKHADNMLLFAQDAQLIDAPWALWEMRLDGYTGPWGRVWRESLWRENYEYRRKPPAQKYITIGDMEVPEPLRVAPQGGTEVWTVICARVVQDRWWKTYNPQDQEHLAAGLVHLTREAAMQHCDALIRLNNQSGH